jgi:hypothetical protein
VILHLVYHCWPTRKRMQLLEWHVEQLHKYVDVFNGRRLVTCALSDDTLTAAECRSLFGSKFDLSFVMNDSSPCESVSWRYQLSQLLESPGAVFRAHAKGASYQPDSALATAAIDWSAAMYLTCLSNVPGVVDVLQRSPCAGPFVRRATLAEWGDMVPWHYSGSFYWLRLDSVRSRWSDICNHPLRNSRHFVEVIPSVVCPNVSDAHCLYGHGCRDLYVPREAASYLAGVTNIFGDGHVIS